MWYEKIRFDAPVPWNKQKGIRVIDGMVLGYDGFAVGIDPGVNFGITEVMFGNISTYYGKLPRQTERGMHGIDAYNLIHTLYPKKMEEHIIAVVEGAAYNRMFKQVELEEVRFGFFLGLYSRGFDVRIVPPASIRLKAFGSGRMQAGDIWPFLNQNAADSVGAALAALEISNEK